MKESSAHRFSMLEARQCKGSVLGLQVASTLSAIGVDPKEGALDNDKEYSKEEFVALMKELLTSL